MSQGRRKKEMKTATIVKIVLIVAIILVGIVAAINVARSKVTQKFASDDENEVQTAEVTVGSINTTVSSSGTLTNEDSEDTVIPETVDVTEIYVEAGDNVEAGDMLASVNSASVLKAMAEIQEDLEDIDEEIDDLEDEDEVDEISTEVAGRVKKIYAKADEKVATTMYDNNALMLLSVDGYMAVDVETEDLEAGDEVTVKVGEKSYDGDVDSVWAGKATILITDDGPAYDAKATVSKDGKKIGSGTLYIHEELAVTGYTGTVKAVKVSENDKVKSGKTLMTLKDASNNINYATLLEKREDLEETLQDLVVIYKEGAVYAKEKGMVTSITETEDDTTTTTTASTMSGFGDMSGSQTTTTTTTDSDTEDTIISICPTDIMTITLSVDESDILSLEVGQEVSVTIDSLGEDTYTGELTDIDTVGTSSSGVTTYAATVTLDKVEGMLEGMSADALITIEGKDNALLVPSDAVHQTSSTSYVYTSYDEENKEFGDMVEVVTGLSNGSYTEITSGLSEGDTVYYQESDDDSNPFGNGGFGGDMGGFGGGGMPSGGQGNHQRNNGN